MRASETRTNDFDFGSSRIGCRLSQQQKIDISIQPKKRFESKSLFCFQPFALIYTKCISHKVIKLASKNM